MFLVICYNINRKLIKLESDFEYRSSEKKKCPIQTYMRKMYIVIPNKEQLENTFEMLWIKFPDFIHFS